MAPASAARSAAGRPARKTDGFVTAAISGTRSTPEASAQRACTNGVKHSVSRVSGGRRIRSGMQGKIGAIPCR